MKSIITKKESKYLGKNPQPIKEIKRLLVGLLKLDNNPAFESEVAAWMDQDQLVSIYAYIHPDEESWISQLFSLMNSKDLAPLISSFEIKAKDLGSNGTRTFDLEELLKDEKIVFENMKEFEVEQTQHFHENISVVTYHDYNEDNGAGGKILDKMPNLEILSLPSAPNADFFNKDKHPLKHLSLQAGYEHEGFVSKLADSKNFPKLSSFEWTDGPGKPRFTSCIPTKHYTKLKHSANYNFKSLVFNSYHASWDTSSKTK